MIAGCDISTVRLCAAGIYERAGQPAVGFIVNEPLRAIDLATECESARLRDPAVKLAASTLFTYGCTAAYIEQPMGRHVRSIAKVERQVGAFIASMNPEISTSLIGVTAWKAAAGLPGNAGKPLIRAYVLGLFPELEGLPQDVYDAAGIALAGFNESRKASA